MAAEIVGNFKQLTEKSNENPRAIFYKKPIKKDNYKLEIDDETPQEIRRQRLLQFQKKCREETFNTGRGILQEVLNSDNEDEENMEIEYNNQQKIQFSRRHKHYANQLMLSEWMLEVPQDFIEKWIMVPCPQGVRCLLVASNGITKSYNRRGYRLGIFTSALPGGGHDHNRGTCTLLDCLWIKEQKVYYILDVLAWSNQPFLNCDTEFRFFWLKSQFEEVKKLQERDPQINKFPILPLPNISCNSDLDLALRNLPLLPPLDGLLFYHKSSHYTKGRTPLVTWLKSFMLPEVIGVSIPPPFDEKPEGYIDYRNYILYDASKKRSKKSSEELMDVVEDNK